MLSLLRRFKGGSDVEALRTALSWR